MEHRPFRLKPTLNFYHNRKRFWIGLFCGMGIAVVVFYFQLLLLQANIYLAREAFNAFIQIPAPQLYWYVGFFASVGFLVGSSVAFLIWLAQYRKEAKRSRRPWFYMAINDQANVLPSFFQAYFKLTFVIFIWFLSAQWMATTDFELPQVVKAFGVMLPTALLLNQWVNIRRYFRVKVYWIGAHLLLLAAVSFGGSLVPLPMEESLQQLFLQKRPYINLHIQYPYLACDDFSNQNYNPGLLAGDLYMGFEGGDTNAPVKSMYHVDSSWLSSGHTDIFRNHAIRQVHFDNRLPMSAIDSFAISYRKRELKAFDMHNMALMYYCNNKPDYTSIKPYTFLKFIFRTCDTAYFADNEDRLIIPVKVWNNGNWTINDKPYTDDLLMEVIDTNQRAVVMITYEPTAKWQQVVTAYLYLRTLARPQTWDEQLDYRLRGWKLPDAKFYPNIWFLSGQACLE